MRLPFFSYRYSPVICVISLLLVRFPAFSGRKIAAPITISAADGSNDTWRNFAKFLDIGKGNRVSGMSELKKYFHRFGYLSPPETVNFDDTFDELFESAVTKYQKNLGLPLTGKLDSDTLNLIMSPRCGVSDTAAAADGKFRAAKRFAYFYGLPRWVKTPPITLTYAFSDDHVVDYLSSDEIKTVVRRAFSRWAAVIPVNFTETVDYAVADVRIGFFRGDHGDGEPFDGVLGVLGHAFSPEDGRLHLDAAETWAVDFRSQRSKVAIDLESVATHEIGHILGLAHSSVKQAIMYPTLSPRTRKVDLRIDDVEGVQALYGSNPNFKFSSLLESDTSSNQAVQIKTRLCWPSIFTVMILLIVRM
ncbi:hypothetical protein Nepgr_031686 [Nepenthes gracilis]|uniref:Peptidase metallopeptidase domain-containing protein n=1 Tax=Nepenthes gracilis TaxID=150966 RepID=A0AAD3TIY5_NEPGR|nr:hypothetical protein Nepgr_031686 [Nepenthes gracilis]